MICTLGMTCAIGATFITITSPPSSAPGGVPPGREVDGREIPIDRYLSDRAGNF
jgi:hypothetical protein